jgi:membrane protease YdiL (CAAX protease family)
MRFDVAPPHDPPADVIRTSSEWMRLIAGVASVFALFHWSGQGLGSDRGQAGLVVCLLVVTATLAVERVMFGQDPVRAARSLGLGLPSPPGLAAAGAVCVALLLVVPAFARVAQTPMTVFPGWWRLVPGLFAQGGIAEEVLFRGYLFGRLRRGRSFWRAAGLSMVPFAGVHLVLFSTMAWPVALAALLLSVVLSIPLSHLFELGGRTIWAPALLHFLVRSTVKIIMFSDAAGAAFPLVWMAASTLLPMFVLLVRRPERGEA